MPIVPYFHFWMGTNYGALSPESPYNALVGAKHDGNPGHSLGFLIHAETLIGVGASGYSCAEWDMFKRLARKLFGASPRGQSQEGFFLNVRCSACGEVFHLFIHKTTDLVQNFDETGGVTYSLKKEIVGGACRNLIRVRMEFDGSKNPVAREIENGEFVEEIEK